MNPKLNNTITRISDLEKTIAGIIGHDDTHDIIHGDERVYGAFIELENHTRNVLNALKNARRIESSGKTWGRGVARANRTRQSTPTRP